MSESSAQAWLLEFSRYQVAAVGLEYSGGFGQVPGRLRNGAGYQRSLIVIQRLGKRPGEQ